MNHPNRAMSYVGQVFAAVLHYRDFLRRRDAVIAGDLNSNAQWDGSRPLGNHSHVVGVLSELGIRSAYHEFRREEHGQESQPTFFMYRKTEMTFHLDYCFVPKDWVPHVREVAVAPFGGDWGSDHRPVLVDLMLPSEADR